MAFARALPARLAPRFADASRLVCRGERASFEAVVADRFGLRLRGLAGLKPDAIVPLFLPRCRSIHTFGMRSAIDVVWLAEDDGWEVVAVEAEVPSRQVLRAPRAPRRAALELPPGDAAALGLTPGVRLELSPT